MLSLSRLSLSSPVFLHRRQHANTFNKRAANFVQYIALMKSTKDSAAHGWANIRICLYTGMWKCSRFGGPINGLLQYVCMNICMGMSSWPPYRHCQMHLSTNYNYTRPIQVAASFYLCSTQSLSLSGKVCALQSRGLAFNQLSRMAFLVLSAR